MTSPRIVSVNVGPSRTVEWAGRKVTSAIWKSPVDHRVKLNGVNLDGDAQADLRVHGGYDKAVYAYASEDYAFWTAALGEDLGPGAFGDNLTTEDIELRTSVIGQRWRVGSAVLEVSEPRMPCFKLGIRMGDAQFVDRFGDAGRFGAYLRIIEEGDIGAGDTIEVGEPPAHGLTIAELAAAQHGVPREQLARIAAIDDIPDSWRDAARRELKRHHDAP